MDRNDGFFAAGLLLATVRCGILPRMRILIFSNTYKPTVSGVVTSISLFRQGLVNAGHDVHIIAPEYEDYQDEEPYVFRFTALDLPERVNLSVPIPFKTTMLPTVRGIKPALIHSQHPFSLGGLATDFARDLNLPLVFTLHSHYDVYARRYVPIVPKLAGIVTEEIVKRYLEKCAHIVAPTPSIRDFISAVALLVKVTARMFLNLFGLIIINLMNSLVRVKVLPDPAEALYIFNPGMFSGCPHTFHFGHLRLSDSDSVRVKQVARLRITCVCAVVGYDAGAQRI